MTRPGADHATRMFSPERPVFLYLHALKYSEGRAAIPAGPRSLALIPEGRYLAIANSNGTKKWDFH
jgi:hypothetical protein